jgi:hypothetical protein
LIQEKKAMYKIIMIVGTIAVVGGWIAYGVWRYEHLEKVQKSFDEYAKKMTDYKRKPYERE